MFYLIVISSIIQIFFSFSLLDAISLKRKTNLIISGLILFLVSSVQLNLRFASLDELVLSLLLLAFSFMNHRKQPVGITLFHLSVAFIIQKTAAILLSPEPVLIFIATQSNDFMIFSYFLLTLIVILLLSMGVRKYLFHRIQQKNKQRIGSFLFMLFFINNIYSLYQYILISPPETQFETLIKMFIILLVFMFTISGISIYVLSNNQKLAFATREKEIEQKAMQLYIDEISKQNEEIRKFRHDYLNILSSLESYLEEGDLAALKAYYQRTIQPTRTLFLENTSRLNDLQKINHSAIRGIFMTKLLLAQEKGVVIHLEIAEKVTFSQNLNALNLIRVLGILLDNAIEELERLEEGELEVALFQIQSDTIIMIQNTVQRPMLPLHQLKQQGFSTKGEKRGFGLSTVDDIISQSSSLLLETTINPHGFMQKMTILGS